MVLDFYKKVHEVLLEEQRLILMVVTANEGSSPGRKGFKMLVTKGSMFGTIGGGIMEHKLVEYARSLLEKPTFSPFIKHQIHDKSAVKDQSGMICSGQQTIAFFDIHQKDISLIEKIISSNDGTITYCNQGVLFNNNEIQTSDWIFSEPIKLVPKVYIIGGGHVGLALSEVLSRLDFELHLLDNREHLNTMESNHFVQSKQVVAFEEIDQFIPEGNETYVVIMSFGYRTDDIIIRRLLDKNFRYIGLLGSKEKIATLFENLLKDGFSQEQINKVFAPIGLNIKSETTQEIAISIAAQLIACRNLY